MLKKTEHGGSASGWTELSPRQRLAHLARRTVETVQNQGVRGAVRRAREWVQLHRTARVRTSDSALLRDRRPWPSEEEVRRLAEQNPVRFPTEVYLGPTTRCNLRCKQCGRTHWDALEKNQVLDFALFERVIQELPKLGVEIANIQNVGEPLLHPRIFDMIEAAKRAGLYTRFSSNLALLTEDRAERMVRSGHDDLQVSIDSYDPAVFDDLRQGTTLAHVLGNLENLCKIKRRLGSATPRIRVSVVLMKATCSRIPEFVKAMKRLGVDEMNFQEFNTEGVNLDTRLRDGSTLGENAMVNVPEAEIERLIESIKRFESPGFRVMVPGEWNGRKVDGPQGPGILTCRELWETSNIDSSGRVTPCCWMPEGILVNLGDVNQQTFKEIWLGPRYDAFRLQHLTNRHHPQCARCQQLRCTVAPPSPDVGAPEVTRRYWQVFFGRKHSPSQDLRPLQEPRRGSTDEPSAAVSDS